MSAFLKKLLGTNLPRVSDSEDEEYITDADDAEIVDELDKTRSAEEIGDDESEGELAIDVYQTKDNVVIKSTIAGVKPEDLDITVASDLVEIKGERRREEEVSDKDYFYKECYWGVFSRGVSLPMEVDVDSTHAEIKDGILTITLPKASSTKRKKVQVKG